MTIWPFSHKVENLWLAWPHSIGWEKCRKKTATSPAVLAGFVGNVFLPFLFLMCELRWSPWFSSAKESPEFSSKTSGWNFCQCHELQTLSRATTPAWAQRGLLGLGDEFFRDYHWVVKVITGWWIPIYIYINIVSIYIVLYSIIYIYIWIYIYTHNISQYWYGYGDGSKLSVAPITLDGFATNIYFWKSVVLQVFNFGPYP
jgi:hypothetical protein